jgi:ABC-type polysaccharide/polyol phosphate export permease
MRLLTRAGITMLHHLVIMVVIIPLFDVPINWATALIIPGLVLYALNGFWIIQLLGTVAARFRDVQLIVQSVLQLAMFVTPIFWKPDFLGGRRQFIVDWNPLAHMIDILRKPLLGEVPSTLNYSVVLGVTLLGLLVASIVYGRLSRRIVYWL